MRSFETIIIADDDPDDTMLLRDAMNEECVNLTVKTVPSGEKLLNALIEEVPDVIFLDLHLPGMNGKECLKEIRMQDRFDGVSIVILTGSFEKTDMEYCMAHGADYFFQKPCTYTELKDIAYEVCNKLNSKQHFQNVPILIFK